MSVFRAGLLGWCLLLVAAGTAAEVVERDFHRTFDVERGHRLRLEHGDGEVTIEPWDRDQLEVRVSYRANYTRVGLGNKIDFDVDFSQSGSTVQVVGRESPRVVIGFLSYEENEHLYAIRAPAYLILELEGDDGDVEITDWEGELSIDTEDGDIDLAGIRSPRTELSADDGDIDIERLSGELAVVAEDGDVRVSDCTVSGGRIRLDDGDATLTRCAGSIRFELVDGDVALEQFRPDALVVRTEDGDVDLDLLASAGMDVEVRTVDGDVTVDLDSGSSVRFSVDTGDGAIRLDAPDAVDVKRQRSSLSGQVGAGEGRLRIESGDGRVVVRAKS